MLALMNCLRLSGTSLRVENSWGNQSWAKSYIFMAFASGNQPALPPPPQPPPTPPHPAPTPGSQSEVQRKIPSIFLLEVVKHNHFKIHTVFSVTNACSLKEITLLKRFRTWGRGY